MSNFSSHSLDKYLVFSLVVSLLSGLRFSTFIYPSELIALLIFFRLLYFFYSGKISFGFQHVSACFLFVYLAISALFSYYLDGFEPLFPAIVLIRLLFFYVILFYSYSLFKIPDIQKFVHAAIYISITGSLVKTLLNIILGTRAYYGYAQLAFNPAPAISGFTLSIVGCYLLISSFYVSSSFKFQRLLFGTFSFLLAIGTFTLSAFVSGVFALLVFLFLKFFHFAYKNFTRSLSLSPVSVVYLLVPVVFGYLSYYFGLLDIGYRLVRVFDKLQGRFDKISSYSFYCQDLSCELFGLGPGSHSFLKGASVGNSSVFAFDQLYGRILFEFGIVGFLLFLLTLIAFSFSLDFKLNRLTCSFPSIPIFSILIFGFLFGWGSEFIFINPSGMIYAIVLSLAILL